MNMTAYTVKCGTCGWFSRSADQGWSEHAGHVHSKLLELGHAIEATEVEIGGWVR